MKTIQHPLAETSPDEIDLFALIQSLWQQKKLIAGTTAAVGALALGYALLAPSVYQASTVLRPAAINELDALNRSEVYKLPPTDALLKVGSALDSYETRLNYFESHQELFKPLEKKGISLEQSFEIFNRDAINLTQPDPKKPDSLSPFIKLELTYPDNVDGVKILNGFVEYAINNQRAQIGADLKVIINNRLRELEEKIDAARSGYKSDKEGKIATLVESDTLQRAKLNDELQALRLQLKIERESRIAQLSEAISIARSLGITRPTTPSAMSDAAQGSSRVMRTEITSQNIPLYFMGTQALEAERTALLKRTSDDFSDKGISNIGKKLHMLEVNRQVEMLGKRANEDLFLKNIEPLRAEVVRLGNLNTDMGKLGLVSIDRKAQTPISPIKPKKALIIALGLVLGCLLGIAIASTRYLISRRRPLL
ncbi:Wzz/FepE/Etk N-terminal domain-containing protein [Pseudomonas weihenstephanensis]|uniref:Wzz/FepE/Etk N-terminal domain-containing protein n=1 Tax=Pseudomonas weihenstephanensis TaxID=1608994 RepID=UPI0006543D7C|nr:Wzz/FepE/Etk N-terminal domain-containing protein [Pseudomonas weihenstephanensis]